MPNITRTKTLDPVLFDRVSAESVRCNVLRRLAMDQTGSSSIDMFVQPGHIDDDGNWVGTFNISVPDYAITLASLIPEKYELCQVKVSYQIMSPGLDPNERMTRMAFVMETLDIWERLRADMFRKTIKSAEEIETHLDAAMELLKKTYAFQELVPINLNHFKALFNLAPITEDE